MVNPHILVGPLIAAGAAGTLPYTVNDVDVPGVLPQAFVAVAVTLPVTNVLATLTFIEYVPAPLVMVSPFGTTQAAPVDPNVGATL